MKVKKLCKLLMIFLIMSITFSARAINTTSKKSGEILGVLIAMDIDAINLSKAALNKTNNSLDLKYANFMIREHMQHLKAALKIGDDIKQPPTTSSTSQLLAEKNTQSFQTLSSLNDKQFEKAYIDAMIKEHKADLEVMDSELQATVDNQELKVFLDSTRTQIMNHLKTAESIQQIIVS